MKLTTKELVYLSAAFTDRTPISLFSNIKATLEGTEFQSLTNKGIIKNNGYNQQCLELLLPATKPERCTRLVVQNDFCILEKYTYKSGDKIILVENSNGDLVFSKPEDFSDVIIGLSEFLGMSKIKTSDISIALSGDEMLVLLAIIDIYRKNALLTYTGQVISSNVLSFQEITNEINGDFENGLVKIITKNFNYKMPLPGALDNILRSLISKNCVVSEQGFKLTEGYATFAKNFLISQSIVLFETFGLMASGEISTAGSLCVTAGLHDFISFSFNNNMIELTSISGSQMLKTIEDFLYCPDVVKDAVQPVQGTGNTWRCSCGTGNTGNFCSTCGSKRP